MITKFHDQLKEYVEGGLLTSDQLTVLVIDMRKYIEIYTQLEQAIQA